MNPNHDKVLKLLFDAQAGTKEESTLKLVSACEWLMQWNNDQQEQIDALTKQLNPPAKPSKKLPPGYRPIVKPGTDEDA